MNEDLQSITDRAKAGTNDTWPNADVLLLLEEIERLNRLLMNYLASEKHFLQNFLKETGEFEMSKKNPMKDPVAKDPLREIQKAEDRRYALLQAAATLESGHWAYAGNMPEPDWSVNRAEALLAEIEKRETGEVADGKRSQS